MGFYASTEYIETNWIVVGSWSGRAGVHSKQPFRPTLRMSKVLDQSLQILQTSRKVNDLRTAEARQRLVDVRCGSGTWLFYARSLSIMDQTNEKLIERLIENSLLHKSKAGHGAMVREESEKV